MSKDEHRAQIQFRVAVARENDETISVEFAPDDADAMLAAAQLEKRLAEAEQAAPGSAATAPVAPEEAESE